MAPSFASRARQRCNAMVSPPCQQRQSGDRHAHCARDYRFLPQKPLGILPLDTSTSPRAAAVPPARLVIHAEDQLESRVRPLESPLRRLRELSGGIRTERDKCAKLCLHIDTLQGVRVHSVDDAGPLVDIPLPAGTYHVTAELGKVRRSYTMTLEPGASFNLRLRFTADSQ